MSVLLNKDKVVVDKEKQRIVCRLMMIDCKFPDKIREFFIGSTGFNMRNCITVDEFFNLNWDRNPDLPLICWKADQAVFFSDRESLKRSDNFFKEVIYLLEKRHKFSYQNWILVKERYEVETPRTVPVKKVVKKPTLTIEICPRLSEIIKARGLSKNGKVVLTDFLAVDTTTMRDFQSYQSLKKLSVIHNALKQGGYTEEHGPFMKLKFSEG